MEYELEVDHTNQEQQRADEERMYEQMILSEQVDFTGREIK